MLGIQDCKTVICSPQSNGMAESFVKTLKRDYLAFVELKDGDMALAELPKIIERYNQKHPHSALGYLSPHEFRVSEGLVQRRESVNAPLGLVQTNVSGSDSRRMYV